MAISPEVSNWREIVRRAKRELKRAERRADRDAIIARRLKAAKANGAKCGNADCVICAVERQDKRDKVKEQRRQGKQQE